MDDDLSTFSHTLNNCSDQITSFDLSAQFYLSERIIPRGGADRRFRSIDIKLSNDAGDEVFNYNNEIGNLINEQALEGIFNSNRYSTELNAPGS